MLHRMNRLKYIFWINFILQLLSIYYSWDVIRLLTKPLICILLIGIVLNESTGHKFKAIRYLLTGLFCCTIGDIMLMLPHSDLYFMMGLGSFLIGHLFYILTFKQDYTLEVFRKPFIYVAILCFSAAGIFIYSKLSAYIGDLKIPVLLYIFVISLMGVMAVGRYRNIPLKNFTMVMLGALLFVISDSILSLNQFVSHMQMGHFWVMITYMLAQYCIVTGILKKH